MDDAPTRFFTRSNTVPPAANTEYIGVDEGNCTPRFIRLTSYNIAETRDLVETTRLGLGAVVQPLAELGQEEDPIQVVEYPTGPVRCSACRGYMNPFFKFIDNGNKFICNLCETTNEVPLEYRCNLDANGLRRDRNMRPELCRGSVEYTVGKEFLARPVQDPCFLFVVDVSYPAVVTGLVETAVASIRQALTGLAANPRARAGIITFDQTVQFYSLRAGRTDPHVMVMADLDDPFPPCPDSETLVRVSDIASHAQLDRVLDYILRQYTLDRMEGDLTTSCVGSAAQVGARTLRDLGGKLLIFQSSLASLGVGKLAARDTASSTASDKEKALFSPQNTFYIGLAAKCAERAITFDLYVCTSTYVDIATMGVLATKTGGQLFYYPGFNAKKDGDALTRDVYHNVNRNTGYDGVMVFRCSKGLRVVEHIGNFYQRRPNELELPSIDCDKTFGIRVEHIDKLKAGEEASIQCAMVYTTSAGIRRIRVHTISVPIVNAIPSLYRYADIDAIINLSLKQASRQLFTSSTISETQQALTETCIETLYIYRKHCAASSPSAQLILPETLKLLPLATVGLVKHALFCSQLPPDERAFLMSYSAAMPAHVSSTFVCPRLMCLSDLKDGVCVPSPTTGRIVTPSMLRLSADSVSSNGVYLLDNSRFLFLWIGKDANPATVSEVIELDEKSATASAVRGAVYKLRSTGAAAPSAGDGSQPSLAYRVNALVRCLLRNAPAHRPLHIISGSKMVSASAADSLDEATFISNLIEDGRDRSVEETQKVPDMSYIDFLCFTHRKIQAKMY